MTIERVPAMVAATDSLVETNIDDGDTVAVLATHATDRTVLAALRTSLAAVDADVTVLSVNPTGGRGEPLPPITTGAVAAADVVVNCGAMAGFPPELVEHVTGGGRHLKLYATIDALTSATTAAHLDDQTWSAMRDAVVTYAERLDAAETVRLETAAGTDLTASLAGMTARRSFGDARAQFNHTAFPTGETDIPPVPGSPEGRLVLDISMSRLGRLEDAVELTVDEGVVVAVEGGQSAARVLDLFDRVGDGVRRVAELGFGMNPLAEPMGIATNDKKLRGSGHIGFGDVSAWPTMTGSPDMVVAPAGSVHLDGIYRDLTLSLDGEVAIDNGVHLL